MSLETIEVRSIMRAAWMLTLLAIVPMASSAIAGSTWFQLDSRNLDNQPLSFKIKTEKTPRGGVIFYVDVDSKDAALSRNVAASLTVVRRKQQVARLDIKEKEHGKGFRFVFEVAPRYLAESKFAFKDIEGRQSPWANDVYWFFLRGFASEK